MRHILHLRSPGLSIATSSALEPVIYQTNRYPSEHSKSLLARLTLVTLWNLRVPPMVRTALIGLLFVSFLASPSGASRIDATRTGERSSPHKSSVHHSARPVHRASRSSRTSRHSARPGAHAGTTYSTARRHARYSTAGRHAVYSSRHIAGLRHARYRGRHAQARFTPLANVSMPSRASRSRLQTDTDTPDAEDTSSTLPSARPGSISSSEPSAPDQPGPAESDTTLAASIDPSTASTREQFAVPSEAASASALSGPVAELHLPRFPQDLRISSYALRGTHDSLVRQNERSEEEDLERIEDDADLQDRIARGLLVRVPESAALAVNPELPEDRRYCRPWTANFLTDLSRAHNLVFHKPLMVSSAVRTVEYQKELMRINHNAADAEGDIVSPHVTGATIDIAKSGLSRREMNWMRSELLAYQNAGVIDVEEEFRQRCFHITVYKNYDLVTHPDKPTAGAVTPAGAVLVPAAASAKDE